MRGFERLIGNTPLVRLEKFSARRGLKTPLFAKTEQKNLSGSCKDRVALSMLCASERRGELKAGGLVVAATSGNTGIALAAVGAARGYRVLVAMPETMSAERRKLLAAYGAEVTLTAGGQGMKGAIARAEELARARGGVLLDQFSDPANPRAHDRTTGPEIWRQTAGGVDVFVAGVGTGGTLTGVGRYLKRRRPSVRVVAAEPAASAVLSGGKAGAHGIEGIGAGFIPATLDLGIIDEIVAVGDAEAAETARELCYCEGIFAGISSGAALAAAVKAAERAAGKRIVVLLPDGGERYLSRGDLP